MNQPNNKFIDVQNQGYLDFPGINTNEGLERVGEDIEIYLQILELFYNSQKDCMINIERSLNELNTNQALHTLHSIKGSAGNIGANDFSDSARQLELALKAGETEFSKLLTNLQQQYEKIFTGLEKHLNIKKDTSQ